MRFFAMHKETRRLMNRKQWYFVLFILIKSSFIWGQSTSIKSKTETRFNKFSKPIKSMVEEYSLQGLLLRKKVLNNQKSLTQYTTFTYDSTNQLIADSVFNKTHQWQEANQYQYDDTREKIFYQREYPLDTNIYIETFENTYDEDGKLIRQIKKVNHKTYSSLVYTYNESGQIVRVDEFRNNALIMQKTYQYRADLISQETNERHLVKGKIHQTIVYHYTDREQLIRKVIYDSFPNSSKVVTEYEFTYNENQELSFTQIKRAGKSEGYFLYKYTYY